MKNKPTSVFQVAFCACAIVLPLASMGCARGNAPPPSTASNATTPQGSSPTAAMGSTATQIAIAEDIRKACHIPDADAYFTFDSSRITSKDRSPLVAVAVCFTSGPLAGKSLRLVGHADPRGASEYNMTLAQARADSVAAFLDAKGLGRAQASSTSRGAMDATGTNEVTWAHDRRVDISLSD